MRGSGNGYEKPVGLFGSCVIERGAGWPSRQAKPLQLRLRGMDYGNVSGFDE